MAKVSYEQAREDHEYLWSIAPANDMTGGYVDQEDLAKLLKSPSKATARDLYVDQINYWFLAGPQEDDQAGEVPWHDPRVVEIAHRYAVAGAFDDDATDAKGPADE